MSPTRQFILSFYFVVLLPTALSAAWNDHWQGSPSLDFFPNRLIGATPQTGPAVQDSRGRLFVGSDALLMYDGVGWSSQPLPDSYGLAALRFGPDQKLWAGGHNQLGYYTEAPDGAFVFTSLLAKLPAEHRRVGFIWGCGPVGAQIFFVSESKILRWDGDKFTVWDFPTEFRLYPVWLGNELWFTHLETGLYRLTAAGPQLEYGPRDLPATNPAFGLERDAGGLRLFSRDGVFYAGKPQVPLCSKEVMQFLQTRPLSSVQRLPDGSYAFGTLGGLAIMSAQGDLLRTLTQEDGLPSNAICGLFLDLEKQLWISHAAGGIARLDPAGAVSLFRRWGQADRAGVFRMLVAGGIPFAATDAGLFRLERKAAGLAQFLPVDPSPPQTEEAAPFHQGILVARFGGLAFLQNNELRPVLDTPGEQYVRILPSHRDPNVCYVATVRKIIRLTLQNEGRWASEDLVELPEVAENGYLDSLDNVWLNSAHSGVWHFDPSTRKLANIDPDDAPTSQHLGSRVTGHGQRVYFFTEDRGYVVETGSKNFRRMTGFPGIYVLQCVASTDGRWLYVVFDRKKPNNSSYGLGRLALDENGNATAWTELAVAKLESAGVPTSLLVTTEDGADALWVGGSEGVIRIKPDQVGPVLPPAQPWLTTSALSGLVPQAGLISTYAFREHHLLIQAGTAEIDARPQLLFQTRLVNGLGDWSQASSRSAFEFTNLTNGQYTFEVRAVNAAGLVSEPVAHTFLILPPWYRTPWAYAVFVTAAIAAIFGYVRFHERRIRARNQQLESLVEKRTVELVKANSAKDEFLAGISHEIRNPMNGVIGIATIIDSSKFDATTREHMAQLRHCATHLSSLLEDILDYSRLQAGAVDLNPQPFDLAELTAALTALTSAESEKHHIPLEIAVSPNVPPYLVGDVVRLRQILLNYIVNALKYSGRGKVCLTIWGQQTLPDQIALTFAVSDDGPGIAPEEQARLFTRFQRGAAAETQRVAGTGLGLALCKTLGEKMGGRLWVESEPGQGSTFYLALSLPVAAGAPARLTHQPFKPAASGVLHALVVDDEEYNRITLAAFLAELGFQVATAATGDEALAIARTQKLQAVFLDVNLPGMSGPEIARALRAMANVPADLPIIATTAYTTAEKRQQCSEAGMNAFLTKPVSLDKIHAALSSATATQRAAAPFHPPGPNVAADPLGSLRLLARRKGIALDEEVSLFFTELASDERLLTEAMKRRDPAVASDTAHRLVGRLAFVQAAVESQLAREIETSSTNEYWDQADESATRLNNLLPGLRERIQAAV